MAPQLSAAGFSGPPPGFTPPAGASGPPAGFIIPSSTVLLTETLSPTSTVVRPPAEFPPSNATGPAGGGFPPSGPSGSPGEFGTIPGHRTPLDTHGSHVMIGVSTMLLVLCLFAVGGRLAARRMIKLPLGSDDYTALVALAALIALIILQYLFASYSAAIGGSTSLPAIMKDARNFGKVEIASQVTYGILTAVVKTSLLLLYRRIFSLRTLWFRIAFWAHLGIVISYGVALFTIALTQCSPRPISVAWTHPGTCIPSKTSATTMGALNAVIDTSILILPVRMVWTLQMSRRRKSAICGVFALGLIGVAVSIARTVSIATDGFQSGALAFTVWSTSEPAVGLVCACLPVMAPLYLTLVARISKSWSWVTSRQNSRSSNSGNLAKGRHFSGPTTTAEKTQAGDPDSSWYSHHPDRSLSRSKDGTQISYSRPLHPTHQLSTQSPQQSTPHSFPTDWPNTADDKRPSSLHSNASNCSSTGRQDSFNSHSKIIPVQEVELKDLDPVSDQQKN